MEQDLRDIKDRLMGKSREYKPEDIIIKPSEASSLLAEEINEPLSSPTTNQKNMSRENISTEGVNQPVSSGREFEKDEMGNSKLGDSDVVVEEENVEEVKQEEPNVATVISGPMTTPEAVLETEPNDYATSVKKSRIKSMGLLLLMALIFILLAYFLYSSYVQKEKDQENALVNESAEQNPAVEQEALVPEEVLPQSEYIVDNSGEIQAQKFNDALRLERVSNFANALIEYCMETNTPIPISAKYVKLNEVNAISDLMRKALARDKQAEAILLDPKNPESYFAYRSLDGKEFEFTAKMEIIADHDCAEEDFKNSGICVYRYIVDEETVSSVQNILK